MNIDMSDPKTAGALIARLSAEIGQTFAANCALDLMCEALNAQNTQLRHDNAVLVAKATSDHHKIGALSAQVENLSGRAKVRA